LVNPLFQQPSSKPNKDENEEVKEKKKSSCHHKRLVKRQRRCFMWKTQVKENAFDGIIVIRFTTEMEKKLYKRNYN
jgi:hypothetical protein